MNRSLVLFLLIAVCLAFAALRFTLPVHGLSRDDVFKDMAHVWVGALFGAAIAKKDKTIGWMAAALTAAEVVAAVSR